MLKMESEESEWYQIHSFIRREKLKKNTFLLNKNSSKSMNTCKVWTNIFIFFLFFQDASI